MKIVRTLFSIIDSVLPYDMAKGARVYIYNNLLKKKDYYHPYFISRRKSKEKYCIFRWNLPYIDLFSVGIVYIFQYQYAIENDVIPLVDLEYEWVYENGEIGKYNMWEVVFNQKISVKDVVKKDHVYVEGMASYDSFSKKACKYLNYDKKDSRIHITNDNWREYYKKAKKLIEGCWEVKPELMEDCCSFLDRNKTKKEKVLGIILKEDFTRSFLEIIEDENYKESLKHHPCNPETEDIIRFIKAKQKEWGFSKIFLSTMYNESIKKFQEAFGDNVIFVDRIRLNLCDVNKSKRTVRFDISRKEIFEKFIGDKEYYYNRTITYAKEVFILSMCDFFISIHSSGAAAALTLNGGKYEDILILDDENSIKAY